MSVLNTTVSYFPRVNAPAEGVPLNLLSILQSDKHKERILHLRQISGLEQEKLKESLPCFTVGGVFNHRCETGLVTPSGLSAVDLDSAEDYKIIGLLNELKKIDCIAYAGLSCRGKRLFCIVPFLHPDKYEKHYERLIQSFVDIGLPMGDECHKKISQARFISWSDSDSQFFNHEAKAYHLLAPERTYHHINNNPSATSSSTYGEPSDRFLWCKEQINKSHSFKEGNRNYYIFRLASYCNKKGVSLSETMKGCLEFVQTDFSENEIIKTVKRVYIKQIDSHNKLPFKI